ncbi:hypothetical protein BDAP_002767 [Binucleata daphniae]
MKIDRSNPNVKNILDVKFSDNALNNNFNVKILAHINGIFCIKLNNKTIKTFPIGINEDGSLYEIGTNKLVHIKNKPVYVRTLKDNKYSEKIYHSKKKYLCKRKQKEIKPKQ